MKKFLSVILIIMLSLSVFSVSAAELATVKLNGAELNFDVPAQIINGRTLVPLRAIFEGLGAVVEWEEATQTVTATKGDTTVTLQIGSTSLFVNGEVKTLDVPAQLVDSRTLVPARAVAESFGAKVDWDDLAHTVLITDETIYNYGALLETALNMPATTSVQAKLHMQASVRMNANEINTIVDADINMTNTPAALEASVSMADGHNAVNAEVYAVEEDGVPTLYMAAQYGHEGSSVQKSTVESIEGIANYDFITGRLYFEMGDGVKVLGEDGNCVKYLIPVSGDNIIKLVEISKINSILPTDTGLDIVLNSIRNSDTVDVTIWIDKDLAQPVKTSFDLAPLMNKVFASQGMDSGAAAGAFTVETEVISYNTASAITVPEEIK